MSKKDKKCNCSPDCDCGCQEGEPCTCDDEECASHNLDKEQEKCHGLHDCDCQEGKPNTCDEEESECDCIDEKITALENKSNEYLILLQRLQAEFENFRKRTQEDMEREKDRAKAEVISVFLPCLDTFAVAKKTITDENILKGFNMIEEKIVTALTELGVEKIQGVGSIYNPNLHEAIACVKREGAKEEEILEEYQSGYIFKGKVIRFAKVVVNK